MPQLPAPRLIKAAFLRGTAPAALAAALLLGTAVPANAWRAYVGPGPGCCWHGGWHGGWWPGAVIGGAVLGLGIGAALAAPYPPAYYAPPPVVYAPPPPITRRRPITWRRAIRRAITHRPRRRPIAAGSAGCGLRYLLRRRKPNAEENAGAA